MSGLSATISEINKKFGSSVLNFGIKEDLTSTKNKIKFSSPRLNYMLYGGIPRGRLIEFAGEENSGKTTTALDLVSNAQEQFEKEYEEAIEYLESLDKPTKQQQQQLQFLKARGPLKCLFVDCENTLDEEWARILNVNLEDLLILKPENQTAEEIFDAIEELCKTEGIGFVVLDSLGVMVSQNAYEESYEKRQYGGISIPLTAFTKKCVQLFKRLNITFIGINQLRDKINSPMGGKDTTGGRAWKHNCFSGNTKFLTDKGLRRFRDCKDGEIVTVVDKDGELREATVKYFGVQPLQKVTLSTPNMSYEVICTPDHRWILSDGSVTQNLQVGDSLYFRNENINFPIKNQRQAEMFCLGMAIGDGTDYTSRSGKTGIRVILCGNKMNYASIFKQANYTNTKAGNNIGFEKLNISKQAFLSGECWKYLTAEDKRYLFMGYYTADGAVANSKNCVTFDNRVLQFILDTCGMAGYYVTSVKEKVTTVSSFKQGVPYWQLHFTTHTNKFNHWTVTNIKKVQKAGTYCVVEPITHSFTLEKGVVTGNCSVRLFFSKGDYFDEAGKSLTRSAESPAGNKVMVNIQKTKVCRPDRRVGYYTLHYTYGIDWIADLVDVAEKFGFINKSGAWFSFVDPETGEIMLDAEGNPLKLQGKPAVINFLEEDENLEILQELEEKINCKICT